MHAPLVTCETHSRTIAPICFRSSATRASSFGSPLASEFRASSSWQRAATARRFFTSTEASSWSRCCALTSCCTLSCVSPSNRDCSARLVRARESASMRRLYWVPDFVLGSGVVAMADDMR